MSEVNHRPWIEISFSEASYWGNACISPGQEAKALPDGWWTLIGSGSVEQQNRVAAYVVKSANCHEQMLAALKEARAMLRVVSLDEEADDEYRASWAAGVAEVDAAIAAAGDA